MSSLRDAVAEVVAAALRSCRVEDGAPVRLIREGDIHHVTHMTTEAILPLIEFTEAQAEEVDRRMSEHMYHHQISNSYAGMACNVDCRTQAILLAVRVANATHAGLDEEDDRG